MKKSLDFRSVCNLKQGSVRDRLWLLSILFVISSSPVAAQRLLKPDDILSMRAVHSVALSPDGKTVAYVATETVRDQNSKPATKSGLWIVSVGQGEPRRCNSEPGEYAAPHWSLT